MAGLKIAMAIDVYDNVRNGGAISTLRFANLLSDKHHVTVATTGDEGAGKLILPDLKLPFVMDFLRKKEFIFAKPDEAALRKLIAKADVLHVQFPFWLGFKAIKIARQLDVPVVTTFHVQAENIWYNVGVRWPFLQRKTYQFFIKHFYGPSNHVIFPSQFGEEELRAHGLTTPGTIISNGFTSNFGPRAVTRPSRHADKLIILMVGRLSGEKRQDVLINAVAQSKYKDRIQLVFAGKGTKKDRLVALGKQLPLSPEFHYLSLDELIQYYNMADLYVHCSEVELECMTALEAIACGLPALLSDSSKSAARQFALDDRFLFARNDATDLARKIDYWFENQNELKASSAAYLASAQQYKIEDSLKKLEHVYYEAVA